MFNPTKSQVAFVIAVVIGLILGKLIKNFKISFAVGLLIAFAFTVGKKRRS